MFSKALGAELRAVLCEAVSGTFRDEFSETFRDLLREVFHEVLSVGVERGA